LSANHTVSNIFLSHQISISHQPASNIFFLLQISTRYHHVIEGGLVGLSIQTCNKMNRLNVRTKLLLNARWAC